MMTEAADILRWAKSHPGVTGVMLADKLDVTPETISRIISGKNRCDGTSILPILRSMKIGGITYAQARGMAATSPVHPQPTPQPKQSISPQRATPRPPKQSVPQPVIRSMASLPPRTPVEQPHTPQHTRVQARSNLPRHKLGQNFRCPRCGYVQKAYATDSYCRGGCGKDYCYETS
jgi:hypothetical protein